MLSRTIFIQQDGVKNHISEKDKQFNDTLNENGIKAELYTQAANSPDVNLLDLGFSQSIKVSTMPLQKMKRNQSAQHITTTPGTRLIEHGLPCNAVSIKSFYIMATMTTTLISSQRQVGKKWEIADVMDMVVKAAHLFDINNTDVKQMTTMMNQRTQTVTVLMKMIN